MRWENRALPKVGVLPEGFHFPPKTELWFPLPWENTNRTAGNYRAVSAEVALALVLTLGAGLLFRSFLSLNAVDLGYRTEGRLVLTVSIPAKTEAEHLEAGAKFERIFAAAGCRE